MLTGDQPCRTQGTTARSPARSSGGGGARLRHPPWRERPRRRRSAHLPLFAVRLVELVRRAALLDWAVWRAPPARARGHDSRRAANPLTGPRTGQAQSPTAARCHRRLSQTRLLVEHCERQPAPAPHLRNHSSVLRHTRRSLSLGESSSLSAGGLRSRASSNSRADAEVWFTARYAQSKGRASLAR